jgi:hypothetical protein
MSRSGARVALKMYPVYHLSVEVSLVSEFQKSGQQIRNLKSRRNAGLKVEARCCGMSESYYASVWTQPLMQ